MTNIESSTIARSLTDQVAELLRMDLLCGRMNAGEPLLENQLVERFGVSRTPIRSALARLTQEGLLEAKSHTSVQVAAEPPAEILALIILIRSKVEVFALRSFYDDLRDTDFDEFEHILTKMKRVCKDRNYPEIAEQDLSLHRYIIHRAGYSDLEAIWMSSLARVRHHFIETQKNYDDPVDIYREHKRLVEVFRQNDIEKAAEALAKNIE